MLNTDTQERSTPFDLQVRRDTRFDFSSITDCVHTQDNLYISHFFNTLSLVAPITEGILIRAIREARPVLRTRQLEVDADAFIAQEAIHSREHRSFNRRLEELGFDVKRAVEDIEEQVTELEGRMSLRERLALVVAGEHVIYSLSRSVLVQASSTARQHGEVRKLFVWHALEEMEHQSVCDDIYRKIYGEGISQRLFYGRAFATASRLLWNMTRTMMRSLSLQSRKPRPGEWRAFSKWLLLDPGIGATTLKEVLPFLSPGFHHWRRQAQDMALIQSNLEFLHSTTTS